MMGKTGSFLGLGDLFLHCHCELGSTINKLNNVDLFHYGRGCGQRKGMFEIDDAW
jgi:hypothetical protein